MRPDQYSRYVSGICLLALFSLTCLVSARPKNNWRIKNRLQTTYEFDNNIREAASDSIGRLDRLKDSSFRFLFESKGSRSSPRSYLHFNYKGGLQTYLQQSIEHKLINEVNGTAFFKISGFGFGTRGSARLKLYLNDELDYSNGSIEAFMRLPPIQKFSNEVTVRRGGLDYQNFPNLDYKEWQLRWSFTRKLSSRIILQNSLALRRLDYSRPPSVQRDDLSSLIGNQRDNGIQLRTQINYTKAIFLNISYVFEHNDSNSNPSRFKKHQIIIFFGIPMSNGVWLRGYAAAQVKRYDAPNFEIPSATPAATDPERDESNFFTLDLSRDINPSLTALLRFSFYNNESIIRDRFYRKSLLTLGFDLRF